MAMPAVLPEAVNFALMETVLEVVPPSVSTVFADQVIGELMITFPASCTEPLASAVAKSAALMLTSLEAESTPLAIV